MLLEHVAWHVSHHFVGFARAAFKVSGWAGAARQAWAVGSAFRPVRPALSGPGCAGESSIFPIFKPAGEVLRTCAGVTRAVSEYLTCGLGKTGRAALARASTMLVAVQLSL